MNLSTGSILLNLARRAGWLPMLALLALAGCGGGADTVVNPVINPPDVPDYVGPAPQNADVQAFKINLWQNIKANNRCGQCHGAGGTAPILFARNDDINLAYQDANTVVNLSDPSSSRMVTKVGGGHNCWLSSTQACADILTTWIQNWAGAAAGGGRQIQLVAPPDKDVGTTRNFPDDSSAFASTVYPVVRQYCSRCHQAASQTPQPPYFASPDIDVAYAAIRTKINLDDPASSRLVVRLRDEFHNCWSDCAANAAFMLQKIQEFANLVPVTQIDPALVVSKALTLYDGTVASGGNRFDNNVIALYEFKTGSGATAFDTSGVEPAANLTISGNVEWVGGWGLNFKGGKAQATTTASKKLYDLIKSTGEYSIEAWIAPGNVAQEDADIVSYSGGTTTRNFTLAQTQYQYQAYGRSSNTDANGQPELTTNANDRDAQASLQHVVVTFDPVNGRQVYVNGVNTNDPDAQKGATLGDWDDTFALVLGNEVSSNRTWTGVVKLVAIHNRALTLSQINQNFQVGVGERYFMLFNVSNLVNVPQSYIMFEASQYDSYGYLFTKPTYINLNPNTMPGSIALKGMRIGVNGAEAKVGQAYIPLNTTITDAGYTAADGERLSNIGTVVALEKGPTTDLFFLTFEQIGTNTHSVIEAAPPVPPPPADNPPASDIGLRTFEEISATMSQITTVPSTTTSVNNTYLTVKQQLPTTTNIEAFLSSHQVGAAQLAISYCSALVDDSTRRASLFPGFNFSGAIAKGSADLVINPLVTRSLGINLTSQPSTTAVHDELDNLVGRLCPSGCSGSRTADVVKAVCAAAVGNGATAIK
jgi:mono/diheme cytochrome c family protein